MVDVGRSLVAHVGGIKRCGSPWSCPMCAPVIRERRAHEIDAALRAAIEREWSVLFLTLTVRHHQGDELGPRMAAMSNALQSVFKGAPWARRRDRFGYVGSVRAIEVTWGESNGWHPHVHCAVVFRRALSDVEVEAMRVWIAGRWARIVERRGFGSINDHGVDLRRVTSAGDLGTYLCKIEGGWSAGHELARGDLKKSGVTPFEMLTRLVETGESRWALLWREYERATYGRRAIMFSPGLRAELLGDVEKSDLELAAMEGDDAALLRAMIERAVWKRRLDECTTGSLLTSIEQTAAWLLWMCDSLGIEVRPLDTAKPEGSRAGSPGGGSRFSGGAGGVPLTPRRLVEATILVPLGAEPGG